MGVCWRLALSNRVVGASLGTHVEGVKNHVVWMSGEDCFRRRWECAWWALRKARRPAGLEGVEGRAEGHEVRKGARAR